MYDGHLDDSGAARGQPGRLEVDDGVAGAARGGLDAVDRLGVEIETALRPPAVTWSPPLVDRQREAVRRALGRRRGR